jgi:hypothetical protein
MTGLLGPNEPRLNISKAKAPERLAFSKSEVRPTKQRGPVLSLRARYSPDSPRRSFSQPSPDQFQGVGGGNPGGSVQSAAPQSARHIHPQQIRPAPRCDPGSANGRYSHLSPADGSSQAIAGRIAE